MRLITDLTEYSKDRPLGIALGTFDGVHIGHRAVIDTAVSDEDSVPAVFTFAQSPAGLIGGTAVPALCSREHKLRMLAQLGVELCFMPDFTAVRQLPPAGFVLLLKDLGVRRVYCGFNFRFGKDKTGSAAELSRLCSDNDMQATVVPPVVDGGLPVSSSRIRELLQNGQIKDANRLLTSPFTLDFQVSAGEHRGSAVFDAPTLNQKLPPGFIHPKYGVYASKTHIDGLVYKSITNVGVHPTVGKQQPCAETNVFGFSGDLYGRRVLVELHDFLRPEQQFENIDALKAAIMRDIGIVEQMDY